jgi:predicted amidohydrolase
VATAVHLVAVQARIDAEPCRSAGAFAARVDALCGQALAGREPGAAALVCFPEVFALPLLFELDGRGQPDRSALALVLGLVRRRWPAVLRAAWGHRAPGPAALLLSGARAAADAYHEAFAAAARRHGAYVVAGSIFLPDFDREISLGTFAASRAVHNLASIYNPAGVEVGRALKAHLTPGLERLCGLRPGHGPAAIVPAAFGRVGVLICLDAFFDSELRRMDAAGVQILVQPSANDGWEQPWKHNRRRGAGLSEAEVWMQGGVHAGIQGREAIQYAVNPMLVGTYAGARFRGRSSIVANRTLAGGESLLAQARSDRDEEFVALTVEL